MVEKEKISKDDGALPKALSQLKKMIVTDVLLPGEQIRQQEVASNLGVSRVPLREALNILAEQGHVIHRPHQGYFVVKRKADELAQVRWMLELMENKLLSSINWPDEICLLELELMHSKMLNFAKDDDWYQILELNTKFHFKIFDLSPHKIILNQVSRLWELAEPSIAKKLQSQEARLKTCEEHEELLQAIKKKDKQEMLSVLDKHRSGKAA